MEIRSMRIQQILPDYNFGSTVLISRIQAVRLSDRVKRKLLTLSPCRTASFQEEELPRHQSPLLNAVSGILKQIILSGDRQEYVDGPH